MSRVEDLRLSDAEARRVAQRLFDGPLVIEAGAGTGKTTILVARILAWCLDAGWQRTVARLGGECSAEAVAPAVLERVVAITFTEAAAGEMAARVGTALAQVARSEKVTGFDPADLPEEACARAAALLANLDRLEVSTIHAFCRRLLARRPLEAGVHPAMAVDADGKAMEEAVTEAVLEGMADEALRSHMRVLGAAGLGPADLARALENLVASGIPAAEMAGDPLSAERLVRARTELRTAAEALLCLVGDLVADSKSLKLARQISEGLGRLVTWLGSEAGPSLEEMCEGLRELFPKNLEDRVRKWGSGSLGKTEAAALEDVLDDLPQYAAAFGRRLGYFNRLDPALFGVARQVLAPLLERVRRRLRSSGWATFGDLLRDAARLLSDSPWVASRERRRIDQLLVDEFQDTDPLQCEVVRRLAMEGPADERPGLFLVGDPKQSIYGWRSADLRAYDTMVGEIPEDRVHRLFVNFRSVPAILDEVRRTVEPLMHREEGVQPAFEPLVACEMRSREIGFSLGGRAPVELWATNPVDDDGALEPKATVDQARVEEARALARELRLLKDRYGVPYSDVGLLLRSMGGIEIVLGALREAGVPYVMTKDRSYYRRREVMDAAGLVRTVLDPGDHLALLTFLRSAVVGVPDAALVPLWMGGFPELATELVGPDDERLAALGRLVEGAARAVPDSIPGIGALEGWPDLLIRAMTAVSELRQLFRVAPSDEFVERLRALLPLEPLESSRFQGQYRVANLERFFRELLGELEEESGDPQAVLRTLRRGVARREEAEEGRVLESAGEAVRILTVHGAKGLDFPHVYLLQMERTGKRGSRVEARAAGLDGRWEYELFGSPTPGWVDVEEADEAREAAERVRLLYVAMTRAKDRLVLSGRWPVLSKVVGPDQAGSLLDLVQNRTVGEEGLSDSVEASARTEVWRCEAGEVQRVFAALAPDESSSASDQSEDDLVLPSPGEVAEVSRRLLDLRREAVSHEARPWSATASAGGHDRAEEAVELLGPESGPTEGGALRPAGRPDRSVATAVGTAVHRILEEIDREADPEEELERLLGRLPELLRGGVSADSETEAVALATEVVDRFRGGNLWRRWRDLQSSLVARELPVVLPPPGEGGPVGFVSGTVDLLYRDLETGALVVADYKTDAVGSDAEIEERVQHYQPQGAVYVRAVREALGLAEDPRFELWFLSAGRLVVVPTN